MNLLRLSTVPAVLILFAAGGCVRGPSVEGAYRLVRRELPDGRVQTPPHVVGHHTLSRATLSAI